MSGARWLGPTALLAAFTAVVAPSCSLGQGTGCIRGTINVPTCWSGGFDLHPNFFAAIPTNSAALQIRVQNGDDFETFSDGIILLVDDLGEVRGDPLNGVPRPSLLGQPLVVGLPAGVSPPGVPITANPSPSIVHATLYLDETCRTQNVALYALDAVTLQADGTCNEPSGGDPTLVCDTSAPSTDAGADAAAAGAGDASSPGPPASSPACTDFVSTRVSGGVATSMIRFNSLFDGNEDESNAKQRLTDADFDLYFADPREICPGGLGPPPLCRGHLQGHIDFYFQRGVPAQPFP